MTSVLCFWLLKSPKCRVLGSPQAPESNGGGLSKKGFVWDPANVMDTKQGYTLPADPFPDARGLAASMAP